MDKPVRKIIRLDNYYYSKNGLYFITIRTIDKNELLWATDVGDGAPDVPLCCAHAVGKVYLSSFGKIIRDNIHRANSVYDDKKILQYVIMPNHIHFILKIGTGVNGTSGAPSPTNEIVPQYVSMLKRFINKDIGFNIFQRSYYDHIIRNQKEYIAISKYIHNNPIKWDVDEYNPRNENNKSEVLGLE
ncbi:transposase [Ruminococcus sp. AM43-6]|jgi:putative transposase|uniref:transposase n=1 Tax=Ruminococcus sp. AM43-6 TaxID=2293216 RepID=UPI000E521E6A|nr:transposase [Ruminococcus sp. AM43-6]RGH37537.1 transposase [Ruminococcus sp. AM43-6]UYJ32732.1 MAG: transposase [Oscillospiraceae bacterium]